MPIEGTPTALTVTRLRKEIFANARSGTDTNEDGEAVSSSKRSFDLKRKRPNRDSRERGHTNSWNGEKTHGRNHPRYQQSERHFFLQGEQIDRKLDPCCGEPVGDDSARLLHRAPVGTRPCQPPSSQPDNAGNYSSRQNHYGLAPRGEKRAGYDHSHRSFAMPETNSKKLDSRPVVPKSKAFRSQGSCNQDDIPWDKFVRRPSFCREGANGKMDDSPRDKSMRHPAVRGEFLKITRDQFLPSLPFGSQDNLQRDRDVRSNVGSPKKETWKSDSYHGYVSRSSSHTPRDNRGTYRGDGTPRVHGITPSSDEYSLPRQLSHVDFQLPALDHPQRPLLNNRQDSLKNRWVPPNRNISSAPSMDKNEAAPTIINFANSVEVNINERRKTPFTKNESPQEEVKPSCNFKVEDIFSSVESRKVHGNSICDPSPFAATNVATLRSFDSTSSGVNMESNDEKVGKFLTRRRTPLEELPNPEPTDSSLDSSKNETLKPFGQILPSDPVVSESPHSSSSSLADAHITEGKKETSEQVKLDPPNDSRVPKRKELNECMSSDYEHRKIASSDASSDSETDEEELMQWARTMFGIQGPSNQIRKPQYDVETTDFSSDDSDDEHKFIPPPIHNESKFSSKSRPTSEARPIKAVKTAKAVETLAAKKKGNPSAARMKKVKETEEEQLKRVAEAKIKKAQAKPPTAAELKAILGDDKFISPSTNWVRRSVRQPALSTLTSTTVKNLVDKLKNNDSDMVVLKMKKYINDPDAPSVVIDAALDALGDNSNCEALYIQNFNKGMRDEQVLRLLEVLMLPTCNIWCLNIGETYNVKTKTWKRFAMGLRKTKVTHMYASEHTISGELKDRIKETIRNNRKKHDKHCNPNNLEVIVQCTHCWWNPMNTKSLRPYLKNKGYEQLLLDKEAQGLRGSTSGAALN